jgi:hypothetical protein
LSFLGGRGEGGGVLEICCFGFERRRVNQSERLGFGRCIYAAENEGNFRLTVLPSSFGMWSRQLKVGFGKWAPLLGSFSFLSFSFFLPHFLFMLTHSLLRNCNFFNVHYYIYFNFFNYLIQVNNKNFSFFD